MIDHALQTHRRAVFRRVDFRDPIFFQLLDLIGDDYPAAAAEDLDMGGVFFLQQIDHVLEGFHMPALIAGHGNTLGVFRDGGVDQFLHRPVVGQMDDLHP
ncbi:MAG: hypothetical protein ACD_75C01492G0002 [uncultured bacterium]|nr:MAG: hypothetical protein ACD_75C01492G0002 [uncultured bacterium]